MSTTEIRFDDGAAYERYMGQWSQLVGEAFLNWLAPRKGLRWLDVGCGNGAFTEMIVDRCSPASVDGIDPSEAQLAHARHRPALRSARLQIGDAMALPFPADSFDAAVMPLVIFFVPEPARGVAEMARVVCGGGLVSAYAWDMTGGGFPYEPVREELRAPGAQVPTAPRENASDPDTMRSLWTSAGLETIQTRQITVQRTFADFDDYWTTIRGGPSTSASMKKLSPTDLERLQSRLRQRLPADASGQITCEARANAITGRVGG
jgi:ubiquinone/menaquinone biosynthesis C-methylase UbiE